MTSSINRRRSSSRPSRRASFLTILLGVLTVLFTFFSAEYQRTDGRVLDLRRDALDLRREQSVTRTAMDKEAAHTQYLTERIKAISAEIEGTNELYRLVTHTGVDPGLIGLQVLMLRVRILDLQDQLSAMQDDSSQQVVELKGAEAQLLDGEQHLQDINDEIARNEHSMAANRRAVIVIMVLAILVLALAAQDHFPFARSSPSPDLSSSVNSATVTTQLNVNRLPTRPSPPTRPGERPRYFHY